MIALLRFLLTLLVLPFRSKSRLEAENAALRHQLIVLQRRVRRRVQLTNGDRLFLVRLYRWFPSVLKGHHDHPARDPTAVAPGWLSPVLVLEIPLPWRPTEDRRGSARVDPAHEHGKSAVGSAAHPWRAAQARLRGRSVQRREVHGEAMRPALS